MKIFQIDAFTSRPFHGNPAAVVPLESWLPDDTMQAIGAEMNLSETAFFVPTPHGTADFHLRWFTPRREVELCGHATLASAHALFHHLGFAADRVTFTTGQAGPLAAVRDGDAITLDFPARGREEIDVGAEFVRALGQHPARAFRTGTDVMCVFDLKREVHAIEPDFRALAALDARGVIITAPGAGHDFVCRFFAPRYGIDEDPVTGSAHCSLAPYWGDCLGKTELTSHQVSARGGEIACRLVGDRVHLTGRCVTVFEGAFALDLA